MKIKAAFLGLLLSAGAAYAQTPGPFLPGQPLGAGQLNTVFAGKLDFPCAQFSKTSTTVGCVPGSNNLPNIYFLRADGTWQVPAGGGGSTLPGGLNLQVQYNVGGTTFGGYTNAQLTALIQSFSSTLSGAVPPSGGGTTNFLRADGAWAVPPGSGGGAVSSVFTRTGAVVAQANDYDFNQIGPGKLALGQITSIAADNLLGNPSGAATSPTVVPLVNCAGGATALNYSFATHLFSCNSISGGAATSVTVGTTTVGAGTSPRVLYDNAGVLGELTDIQLTARMNAFTTALSGAAPASGGGTTNFLRADGTWTVPAGVTPGGASGNVQTNNGAGGFGGLTDIQLTARIQAFTSALSGAVPASGGAATNFLNGAGGWTVPANALPGGATNTIQYNLGGGTFGGFTMSQDCTITVATGVIVCTKTNNVAFAASATTDTTNANNITSGILGSARGGAGTINGALKGNGAGVVSQAACADLSNAAASCSTDATNANNIGSGTLNQARLPATSTQTIASGAAALMSGSAIASASCATVITATATGVATTDVVTASFNGDPTAVTGYVPLTTGMLTIIPYPTLNNVNFKVCNNTSASITPGAITLNWRVVR